jgi:GNAT superfamily N-acetyltransferase
MRLSTDSDRAEIAAILAEVREWMLDRGIRHWAPPFTNSWICEKIAGGEFYLGHSGHLAIATMRLQWSDPATWGARERGDAAYIHTLAVRRAFAGQGVGGQMLRWAEGHARATGRRALRLDCVAGSAPLVAYYLRHGFLACGEAEVGGVTVALFEKRLSN